MRFGYKFTEIASTLIATSGSVPLLVDDVRSTLDVKRLFRDMEWGDCWDDAGMKDVIVYLRANRNLNIPPEWRPYIPTELPD